MAESNFNGFEKCKSCTSKYSKEINQKLLKGESQRSVVKWLKSKGETISQASIGRHYNNHLMKNQENAGYDKAVNQASKMREAHPNWQKSTHDDHKTSTSAKSPETPETAVTVITTDADLIFEKMKHEFDAFNELLNTIAIQKARMNSGLIEETKAGMLLNTVDRSINTYALLIVKFKELMSGAENLQMLHFVQMQNLIAEIFSKGAIPDNVKFTMMNILNPATSESERKVIPIRPAQT